MKSIREFSPADGISPFIPIGVASANFADVNWRGLTPFAKAEGAKLI
jgi:hypothetical protein